MIRYDPFPHAIGNEEETGLILLGPSGVWYEPSEVGEKLKSYIPRELAYFSDGHHVLLQNGSLIYPGGGKITTTPNGGIDRYANIERATAEQSGPETLPTAIGAHELLLEGVVTNFLKKRADDWGELQIARIQRRTVDAFGSRKASHFSFGFDKPKDYIAGDVREGKSRKHLLCSFFAAETFLIGAGYVSPHGLKFAQKAGGLQAEQDYDYSGSMFRLVTSEEEDTGPRFEKRCSDTNISPWQIRSNAGATGLVLALMRTSKAAELAEHNPIKHPLNDAKRFNGLELDEDGQIIPRPHHVKAVDFVERAMELAISGVGEFIQLHIDYELIAQDVIRYCHDFKKVLKGELPYSALADRVDHAVKFGHVVDKIRADKEAGKVRSFQDFEAMRDDMLYDNITISARPGGYTRIKRGYGYRHRDSGKFLATPSKRAIRQSYLNPPKDTRAALRGRLIRDYSITGMHWSAVRFGGSSYFSLGGPRDVYPQHILEVAMKIQKGELNLEPES